MNTSSIELTANGSNTEPPSHPTPPALVEYSSLNLEPPNPQSITSPAFVTDLETHSLPIINGGGALAVKEGTTKEDVDGTRGRVPHGGSVAAREQQLQHPNTIAADARLAPPAYEEPTKTDPVKPVGPVEPERGTHPEAERLSSPQNPMLQFLREGCGMRLCGVRALALPPALVRWYVLLLVCAQQVLNALIWLTWSPVGNTASRVFGWSDLIIVLLNGIGAIFLTVCAPISAWVIGAIGHSSFLQTLYTAHFFLFGSFLNCSGFPINRIATVAHFVLSVDGHRVRHPAHPFRKHDASNCV